MTNSVFFPSIIQRNISSGFQNVATQTSAVDSLIACASLLLIFLAKIRCLKCVVVGEVSDLRSSLITEISIFSKKAVASNYSKYTVFCAEYCLCTALDEAILSTAWGGDGSWSHQTLLSSLQKETWGGEKFFLILEEMMKGPKENLPILELLYVLLSLGFEGKYYHESSNVREEIQYQLFEVMAQYCEEYSKKLSPSLQVLHKPSVVSKVNFSKLRMAIFVFASLCGLCVVSNVTTYFSAKSVLSEFLEISSLAQEKFNISVK